MTSRTAKFVSAVFASVLASAPLTTVSHGAARPAEDCLSAPKGAPPQGGHWYYRIDRATKRHCWYVGDARANPSQAKPQDSAASANPASPVENATTQQSIADAHAELPLQQARVELDTSATAAQRIAAPGADAAENNQRIDAGDAPAQRSVIASRWPEAAGASSSASPAPAARESIATPQSSSASSPPPAIVPVALAVADASSEKASASIQMLLIVIVGALSLAGLMGSVIFRFGSTRPIGRHNLGGDRRSIWDTAGADRLTPQAYANTGAPMRRADFPRGQRAADDPNERIAEMMARLARSAQT